MLAFLYLIASFLLGAGILFTLKPWWEKRVNPFVKDEALVHRAFLFLPAAWLVGTLLLSWVTYFFALAFQASEDPLLYANLFSFFITILCLFTMAYFSRKNRKRDRLSIKDYHFSGMEWFILIGSILFWSVFILRSLYMEGSFLHAGNSAFSDFGAHLPVIRSFSVGQNFPAQYPHFPDGTMRYHFMFYFLAGNLEYLGFSLPLALNLPSVLSLVCLTMLLYGLCTALTKKPLAGFFTCLFFAFRSSFAFFTYANGFSNPGDFWKALGRNLDAGGNSREHIGNTLREGWGLWAQKVYINQRHLAFAFGLAILVLFLLLPLFMETVQKIKNKNLFRELLFTRDAWVPKSWIACTLSGLLLGMLAFWNGAVLLGLIAILFVMAALSKYKLEYLVTAVIAFILSTLQSGLFIGSGTGAVSIQYEPGFLAESSTSFDVSAYYVELLGLLPFILLAVVLVSVSRKKKWPGVVLSVLLMILLILFMPSMGTVASIFTIVLFLGLMIYLLRQESIQVQGLSPWLIPVFLAPILLATTLQLTPDITVNHKYIIMAVLFLNIPVSDLLAGIFQTRKKTAFIFGLCIVFMLTCTGLVDMVTLYNLDRNSVSYNQKDPVQVWTQSETEPGSVFLTHYMTHYNAPMSILLAGRSVYPGYPYFTMTAGYDAGRRDECMKRIYSAVDAKELRNLAVSEGINYIVIEYQNRNASEYTLNEEIFYLTFPVAYKDEERDIVIFQVE